MKRESLAGPRDAAAAGMSTTRLKAIDAAIGEHVGTDKLAGVVTLTARHGEVVHSAAAGLASREEEAPMRPDTIFRIYSMTKPIVCVALMTLWEQSKLRLSDPVSDYIPCLAGLRVFSRDGLVDLERPVTIHDLMTHTSGLTYHFLENGEVEELYRESDFWDQGELADFVRALSELPLAFQPGEQFRYSVAHDVVGHLIEVISGRPLDTYLLEAVLDPVGMVDTRYELPPESRFRCAAMYGSLNVEKRSAGSEARRQAEAGVNRLLAAPGQTGLGGSGPSGERNYPRGGHGLFSTAPDYLRFCRMLLQGGKIDGPRILGRKTVELMTVNHLAPHLLPYQIGEDVRHGYGYGLGFRVLMDLGQAGVAGSVGEYGWGGAATTYFWVDPVEDLIGVQMAQFQPSQFHPVGASYRTAAYQAIDD